MKKELWRQLVHASGVFIVLLGFLVSPEVLILLCIALVVLAETLFQLDKSHHIPLFSTMLSNCKRKDDERGFVYFFIGIIVTIYLFKFDMGIVNAAILILLFGDSASTIIGKRFGRHKLPFQEKKTFEGSISFFIIGSSLAITQLPLLPAISGAFFGAVTEAYSPVDDNIPIPIVSALAMSLIIYIL
ncbi:hypothetical protein DSECCO2_57950 [anaerobic digester metagenome]